MEQSKARECNRGNRQGYRKANSENSSKQSRGTEMGQTEENKNKSAMESLFRRGDQPLSGTRCYQQGKEGERERQELEYGTNSVGNVRVRGDDWEQSRMRRLRGRKCGNMKTGGPIGRNGRKWSEI